MAQFQENAFANTCMDRIQPAGLTYFADLWLRLQFYHRQEFFSKGFCEWSHSSSEFMQRLEFHKNEGVTTEKNAEIKNALISKRKANRGTCCNERCRREFCKMEL